MINCKNCIHCEICDEDSQLPPQELYYCRFFKDKSKFIEKQFDIGDQIYIITRYSHYLPYEIIKCTVSKIRLKSGNTITFSCYGYYEKHGYYSCGNFKTSSIGKTVFLTREEAEKKLGELK